MSIKHVGCETQKSNFLHQGPSFFSWWKMFTFKFTIFGGVINKVVWKNVQLRNTQAKSERLEFVRIRVNKFKKWRLRTILATDHKFKHTVWSTLKQIKHDFTYPDITLDILNSVIIYVMGVTDVNGFQFQSFILITKKVLTILCMSKWKKGDTEATATLQENYSVCSRTTSSLVLEVTATASEMFQRSLIDFFKKRVYLWGANCAEPITLPEILDWFIWEEGLLGTDLRNKMF